MDSVQIEEVLLPGVGLRYEFVNHRGARIAIVALRGGDFEVFLYEGNDPDLATSTFHLDNPEADALAQIFGAPRISERFADVTREVPGLGTGQFEIKATSAYVDRPLGDTRTRTRTGASIVAIVRGDDVITSPTPAEILRAGDVLVVIGNDDGLSQVARLIAAD